MNNIDQPTIQRVSFEPHPKQREFVEAVFSFKHRFLLFGGAAGGGKSFVSLAILIMLAKIFPGSKSHVVRESLPTLKRTTIPSFFKLCPKKFIKNYNQSDQVVTFTNGSTLSFFPENYVQDKNLTRFDGLETNFFLIEEGQECQEKTFEKCKLRAGRHIIPGLEHQPKPMILVTCNPSQNWTKKVFHEPAKNGTLGDQYFYLQSLMKDNPSLTEEYLEGLENIDEVTRAIFVDGDWDVVDVGRPYAYSFRKNKHVRPDLQINKNEPIILSFDFNVDPITCIAGQSYGNTIRILKEFRLTNSDIFQLCQHVRSTFGDQFFIITGDASGQNRSAMTSGALNYYRIIQKELDLPKSAFKVPTFNPGAKNARVLMNSVLERHGDFLIDASCLWTINDLQFVEVDEAGEMKKDRTNENKKADLLDCLKYYLWTFHSTFIKFITK